MYILVYICVCFVTKQYDPSHYEKTHPHSRLQVPTTQLAKMSIDPKFVELTADVLGIFYQIRDNIAKLASKFLPDKDFFYGRLEALALS